MRTPIASDTLGDRLRRALSALGMERWRLRQAGSVRVYLFYLPGPGPRLMSWLRKRWVLFRNHHARIEFNGPAYLGPRFSLDMPRGGTFIVGPGVEFRRGFRAELATKDARITIGAGCVFSYDVIIQCGSRIEIGDHCMFGQAGMIVDGNHRFRDLDTLMLHQGYDLRPVKLSDHVTVMTKCTIIADIGERTVVGANSVVSRPQPAFCVVGGVPAKILEYFGPPGQEPPELAARSASAETAG
jgi:acetyltransferase-like isoleucine patch superfamily enzyme